LLAVEAKTMPNVYATPDDCKSELGKKMQFDRAISYISYK